MKLLGHIIRAALNNRNDPLSEITFSNIDILEPLTPAYKRVGKPRFKWAQHVLEKAWRHCREEGDYTEYTGTIDQVETIKIHALFYQKPF